LDQAGALGPADLVVKGDGVAPFGPGVGEGVMVGVSQDHAHGQSGAGNLRGETGNGLDDRALERAGNDLDLAGAVTAMRHRGHVLRNEILKLLLLVAVPGDADTEGRAEA